MDRAIDKLFSDPIDLEDLLSKLGLAEETLRSDSFEQPKLFEHASRFYVRCMTKRFEVEGEYDERKADRGLYFRRKFASRAEQRGKAITEKEINERVLLLDSVRALRIKYEHAKELETYAEKLMEAFKQRNYIIRGLLTPYESSSRAEWQEFKARKSQEEFDDTRYKLNKKFSGKRL
jgi:hypothetical protein